MIAEVLAEAGADTNAFAEFASGDGRITLDTVNSQANQLGVFGVPTIVLDGEIFWGREQFPMVRLRLNELGLARGDGESLVDIAYPWRPGGAGVGGA